MLINRASMAEACSHRGRSEQTTALVNEAVDQMKSTDELMLAEEIYRIAGMVRLRCAHDSDGAVGFLEKPLDHARRHGTRSYELRAAMYLARLWRQQGKRSAARHLLAPIYDWFTEGFGTADLKEAGALLKELSDGPPSW